MNAPRVRNRSQSAHSVEAEPVSNVVVFRPDMARLPVSLDSPSLLMEVTKKEGKKDSKNNDLLKGPGPTQVTLTKGLSPSRENFLSAKDPAFQRLVARLSATELRERFVLEASSHNNMLGRERQGSYTVDPAFRNFRKFLAHVGPKASKNFTLDRIDPSNPVYGPGLVRWADKRQQANNRDNTVYLTKDGVTRPLADWGRLTGQNPRTIAKRIERGWSHKEAINGRRVENEPVPHAAKARGLPTVPIATSPLDQWPPGAVTDHWEPGFLAFQKRFRNQLGPGLHRIVFFAWIAGNNYRRMHEILDERHPTAPDSLESNIPINMPDYPIYDQYWKLDRVTNSAVCTAFSDDDSRDLLVFLKENFPNRNTVEKALKIRIDDGF